MSEYLNDSIVLITSKDEKNPRIGTGFIIGGDKNTTFVATCAHVINQLGGKDQIIADEDEVQVIELGDEKSSDIAILQINRILNKPHLKLILSGEEGDFFTTVGFQMYGKKIMLKSLKGKLDERVNFNNRGQSTRFKAWGISFDGKYGLQPGYSGSPIIVPTTDYVLGIISAREGDGYQGIAISVEAISTLWHRMPQGIKPIEQDKRLNHNPDIHPNEIKATKRLLKKHFEDISSNLMSRGMIDHVATLGVIKTFFEYGPIIRLDVESMLEVLQEQIEVWLKILADVTPKTKRPEHLRLKDLTEETILTYADISRKNQIFSIPKDKVESWHRNYSQNPNIQPGTINVLKEATRIVSRLYE